MKSPSLVLLVSVLLPMSMISADAARRPAKVKKKKTIVPAGQVVSAPASAQPVQKPLATAAAAVAAAQAGVSSTFTQPVSSATPATSSLQASSENVSSERVVRARPPKPTPGNPVGTVIVTPKPVISGL